MTVKAIGLLVHKVGARETQYSRSRRRQNWRTTKYFAEGHAVQYWPCKFHPSADIAKDFIDSGASGGLIGRNQVTRMC